MFKGSVDFNSLNFNWKSTIWVPPQKLLLEFQNKRRITEEFWKIYSAFDLANEEENIINKPKNENILCLVFQSMLYESFSELFDWFSWSRSFWWHMNYENTINEFYAAFSIEKSIHKSIYIQFGFHLFFFQINSRDVAMLSYWCSSPFHIFVWHTSVDENCIDEKFMLSKS